MPVAYSYDSAEGLIRTVVTGHITREDAGEYFRRVREEPYFPAPSLTDVRDADAKLSGDEVRAITNEFRHLGVALKDCPIAVLVSSDLSYGLTRMIGLLLDDIANILPFRNPNDAMTWLKESRHRVA